MLLVVCFFFGKYDRSFISIILRFPGIHEKIILLLVFLATSINDYFTNRWQLYHRYLLLLVISKGWYWAPMNYIKII